MGEETTITVDSEDEQGMKITIKQPNLPENTYYLQLGESLQLEFPNNKRLWYVLEDPHKSREFENSFLYKIWRKFKK